MGGCSGCGSRGNFRDGFPEVLDTAYLKDSTLIYEINRSHKEVRVSRVGINGDEFFEKIFHYAQGCLDKKIIKDINPYLGVKV